MTREGLDRGSRPLESLYLGGGTPSLFSANSISFFIKKIKDRFSTLPDCEVTIEANPDSINTEKLIGLRKGGVNRLSIGFQALEHKGLKALGRIHSAEKAIRSFLDAREAGFDNIGADLIYGIPGQTLNNWENSLKKLLSLNPEHVSLYNLTIEEGTPFYNIYKKEGRPSRELPGEELEIEMYKMADEMLTVSGYTHYEISNWAKEGFQSVHNSRYWLGKDYIGLGVSAHSFLSYPGWGRRWWNELDPLEYMKKIDAVGAAIIEGESLGRKEALSEAVILGLRMLERGITGEDFRERFGVYPKEALDYKALEEDGLIRIQGEDILLTTEGVLLSNEVFVRLTAKR